MQIINTTPLIPRNNYYNTTPSFNGKTNATTKKLAREIFIEVFPNGKIGKIPVKKANGRTDFLQLEKYTTGGGNHDAIYLKDNKGRIVGFIELTINTTDSSVLPKNKDFKKHVFVSNCVNCSVPGTKYYNDTLEQYEEISTKLMQIALRRSEERNCLGNIELHAYTKEEEENLYNMGFIKNLTHKQGEFDKDKMYLPADNIEFLRQRYGGFELILPDGRVLQSKRALS